jgi:hypothetical protein
MLIIMNNAAAFVLAYDYLVVLFLAGASYVGERSLKMLRRGRTVSRPQVEAAV